jgi:hypothetical protein
MPAVNTPQFDWVLSRLPRKAQPVPPIYHPKSPHEPWCTPPIIRTGVSTGASTAATLLANAVAPGLLDRYLARTGYDSQQTSEPQDATIA